MAVLYRKRLIPDECILLADDKIIHMEPGIIITKWKTLHPKPNFSHGISYYDIEKGWKISKFFKEDNTLSYIYCDIIDTDYNASTDTYVFTDLLADVIIQDSQVKVVDLDELADACSQGIISNLMLVSSLHKLDSLLNTIYDNSFKKYISFLDLYL